VRPLPGIDPALHRHLRTIESAQGPSVTLDGREVLLLCSNDYLGLAGDPRVGEAAARAARVWGAGAGASPSCPGT
jgi:7-keto-8-aminopelargonate synthetase-like enzyme